MHRSQGKRIVRRWLWYFVLSQSSGLWPALLFKLSRNCANYYFCPYNFLRCSFFLPYTLIKPLPKFFQTFQVGSAWLSLAQLGSAWLLSGVLSPNLASFSPKPFGHVTFLFQFFGSKSTYWNLEQSSLDDVRNRTHRVLHNLRHLVNEVFCFNRFLKTVFSLFLIWIIGQNLMRRF